MRLKCAARSPDHICHRAATLRGDTQASHRRKSNTGSLRVGGGAGDAAVQSKIEAKRSQSVRDKPDVRNQPGRRRSGERSLHTLRVCRSSQCLRLTVRCSSSFDKVVSSRRRSSSLLISVNLILHVNFS